MTDPLPGQEIRYTTSGGVSGCTRYYSHNGTTVASRTNTALTWQVSDHQGTQNVVVDEATQTQTRRRQDPFGNLRGSAAVWPNNRGFVSGFNDPHGLTHLGAREYDAAMGRFISDDPVTDFTNPQQINGYSYANNSAITFSDPSGLYFFEDVDGGGEHVYDPPKYLRQKKHEEKVRQKQAKYDPESLLPKPHVYTEGEIAFEVFGTHMTNLSDEDVAFVRLATACANNDRLACEILADRPPTNPYAMAAIVIVVDLSIGYLFDIADGVSCAADPSLECAGGVAIGLIPGYRGLKSADEAFDAADAAADACRRSFDADTPVLMAEGL